MNIQQWGGIFLIVPLFCLLVCWSTLSSLKVVCLILKDKKWLLLKKRIFTNQLTKKLYCGDLQHPVARVDTHACNWQYKLLINLHPPNPLETFASFSVWAKDINYTHSHDSYIQWPGPDNLNISFLHDLYFSERSGNTSYQKSIWMVWSKTIHNLSHMEC